MMLLNKCLLRGKILSLSRNHGDSVSSRSCQSIHQIAVVKSLFIASTRNLPDFSAQIFELRRRGSWLRRLTFGFKLHAWNVIVGNNCRCSLFTQVCRINLHHITEAEAENCIFSCHISSFSLDLNLLFQWGLGKCTSFLLHASRDGCSVQASWWGIMVL